MTREQLEKELDRAYSEQHRAESLFRNDDPYVPNKTYDKLWQNVRMPTVRFTSYQEK